MNHRAIEFHDSTLLSVKLGRDLRVELSAYVHVSEGEPGCDAGTGWEQDLELVLTDPVVEMTPSGAVEIADGLVQADEQVFAGLLPLPFTHLGSVRLELRGVGGELRATARGLHVVERGEPRFVEDVPPLA